MKLELFKNKMFFMADKVYSTCSDTIFLGDMNCCVSLGTAIKDSFYICDLMNLIQEPTCHKDETSTVIDAVLISNPRKYVKSLNYVCELSDFHNLVGIVARRFAPSQRSRHINYLCYKDCKGADFLCNVRPHSK